MATPPIQSSQFLHPDRVPSRKPDMEGLAGRAWEIVIPSPLPRPDWAGSCGAWLVYCPHASPVWDTFYVGAVHLRPIEGQSRPPYRGTPGATHEVFIMALNPEKPFPDISKGEGLQTLAPLNGVAQVLFTGTEAEQDEKAKKVAEACAKGIITAIMGAEGGQNAWARAITSTADHFESGHRGPLN